MRLISIILLLLFSFTTVNATVGRSNNDCIDIDESKKIITPSGCNQSNGSITGLVISGATTFVWSDINGIVVGNEIDLKGVPAGIYSLALTDGFDCKKFTSLITIPTGSTPLLDYHVYGINAACDANNGSFHIDLKNLPKPDGIRWTNEAGKTLGNDIDLYGLDVGTYNLYLMNKEGCEILYRTATLRRILDVKVDLLAVQITDDVCEQSIGSITGLKITDGFGPFFYQWKDEQGNIVSTSLELINVSAGNYTISITDGCGKESLTQSYVIKNGDISLVSPNLDDIKICSPQKVKIEVKNPKVGSYRFYDSSTTSIPIFEGQTPYYETMIDHDVSFYVSYALGDCESSRTKVNISLGISTNSIPNAFSPNGDGVNDTWNLSWLSYYKDAVVQVFNRTGQVVYNYTKDSTKFNGKLDGKDLSVGTYYYLIRPGAGCNQIAGTVTLIR